MDREKVIKGLQSCQNIDVICMDISCYEPDYSECPYHGRDNCVAELCRDALALLKEHEAVVRCKDCKFRGNTSICPLAYIEKTEQFTALCVDEWFCGNGKRKEGR